MKTIVVLLAGSGVTKDFRQDRVRVFVNINNEVVEVPTIGWNDLNIYVWSKEYIMIK